MVAPLGRRSRRKSSEVRKIFFCLWTWKIVAVTKLGNKRISRAMTSTSPWKSHKSLKVWKRWKQHLQSQKENWKYQERGWLPLWVSRPKEGFAKVQKGRVWHQKCQWEGPFKYYQRVWENWETTLWEEEDQIWAYWQLLSYNKATCKMYDEIW